MPPTPVPGGGLHHRFEAHVRDRPEAVAVVGDGACRTYAELDAAAEATASELRAHGVGPGDVVAIRMRRGDGLVAAMIGVLKVGAAYLPLDVEHPPERVRRILIQALPTLLVADEVSPLEWGLRTLVAPHRRAAPPGPLAPPEVEPDSLAYVIFTSGSTGEPKGVMVEHRNVLSLLDATVDRFGFGPDDVWTMFHSPAFDFSVWEMWGALAHGGRLVVVDAGTARDPRRFARLLVEQHVTVLNLTPSALGALAPVVAEPAAGTAPGGDHLALRHVILGGERLTAAPARRWLTNLPGCGHVVNMYGITETTVHNTWAFLDRDEVMASDGPLPVGQPLPHVGLHLLDREGRPVAPHEVGEFHVTGAGVARGYLGQPALTAERFLVDQCSGERMYRTGDLGSYEPEADRYWHHGRNDEQVQIRGHRVEPAEIQAAIVEYPGVEDAAVVVDDAAPAEPVVHAFMTGSIDEEALAAWLTERLPGYMRPGTLTVVGDLPRDVNDKLDRDALLALLHERQAAREVAEPVSELEGAVVAAWREVLGRPDVGRDDDFFSLGGNSISAVRVQSRLARDLHRDVPLRVLLEPHTPSSLAASLGTAQDSDSLLASRDTTRPAPLSAGQARMWFVQQLDPDSCAYNVVHGYRLSGRLRRDVLEDAVGSIMQRHEVLRTRPEWTPEGPVQRLDDVPEQVLDVRDLGGASDQSLDTAVAEVVERLASTPFDIEEDLPFEALLLAHSADEHALVVRQHHISTDAWSLRLFYRELQELYRSGVERRPAELPELRRTYGDYAQWQQEWLESADGRRQLDFWATCLADVPPPVAPRPDRDADGPAGVGVRYLEVDTATTTGLRAAARAHGVTLFTVLVSAAAWSIARDTGVEDVVIGAPVANRRHVETEHLVGFFINRVVLRFRIGTGQDVGEVVPHAHRVCVEAFANQDYPFDRLVQALDLRLSDAGGTPVRAVFNMHNVGPEGLDLPGITASPIPQPEADARVDFTIVAQEMGSWLLFKVIYRQDLYSDRRVDDYVEAFLGALRRIDGA